MVRRGRRFESVRGLCKGPAKRGFLLIHDLQRVQVARSWKGFGKTGQACESERQPCPCYWDELAPLTASANASSVWGALTRFRPREASCGRRVVRPVDLPRSWFLIWSFCYLLVRCLLQLVLVALARRTSRSSRSSFFGTSLPCSVVRRAGPIDHD